MKGYLYNILGEGIEELYWSKEELDPENLQIEYQAYELDLYSDEGSFEDWYNERFENKIERVFLNEIYV